MGFDVQNINGFIFNLSPLNASVSRKVISFSDISAVNLMAGWNICGHVSRLVTVLYFLVFFSIVRLTCRKKTKETRANWKPRGLRSSRFLSKRASTFFSLFMTVIQISSLRRGNNPKVLQL